MVQFPATAAIEYVAACWVPGAGGDFCRGNENENENENEN